MSWMEELEQMESSEEIKEERNYDSTEEKSNEESTNIDSLEDLLKKVDANFDALGEDVNEALEIVKDRLDELIKKGDEFGITDKQKENIIEKYNRMIGPKTNKL